MSHYNNSTSSGKGPVAAADAANSDSNDGNDKKDTKARLIQAANTEELGRALTKSFRYNLVRLDLNFSNVFLVVKSPELLS